MRTTDLVGFAAGALRGHGLRSGLSLLGVAIGVASVIMLTSLGEGARLYVTGEFASLGSNLLFIMPGKTETSGGAPFVPTTPNDLTLDDVDALVQRVPGIERAVPMVLGTAATSYESRSRQTPVIGTTHGMLEVRHLGMGVGRFLPEGALRALQSALDNGYPAKMLAAEPYLEDLKQNRKFRRMISANN